MKAILGVEIFALVMAILYIIWEFFDCLISRKENNMGIIPFFLNQKFYKSLSLGFSIAYIITISIVGFIH